MLRFYNFIEISLLRQMVGKKTQLTARGKPLLIYALLPFCSIMTDNILALLDF